MPPLTHFCISYTYLRYSDQFEERSAQRGEELAKLLTRLGPTFIKVGQSLSIRTDLLSPGYVRGLALLQDQVPPFDTKAARAILEAEWGRPLGSVIEGDLTDKPVAAASLGQVYKARLKGTDQEVAIKGKFCRVVYWIPSNGACANLIFYCKSNDLRLLNRLRWICICYARQHLLPNVPST
jgi:predicted unusual protein kinase regulating ubiquinone biosynthesis (AarF/ABC1/UbiB family)